MRKPFSELTKEYEKQLYLLDARTDADRIIARMGRDSGYNKAVLANLIQRLEPSLLQPKQDIHTNQDDKETF